MWTVPEKRLRPWRERLFTLPWSPFQKYDIQMVPLYLVGDKVFGHPDTINIALRDPKA